MRALLVLAATPLLIGAGPASVDVTVSGIRSTQGMLSVCIMPTRAGFPACAKAASGTKQRVAITGGTVRVRFANLPNGTYAVTAFHDEDNDGNLKTNFIGIPKEGVAISGKVGGIPSFGKSAVPVGPGTVMLLTMRYL